MFAADTPVWVVFSKADSIPFFRDYFTRLRDNEDQQPLGCTLDLISGAQRPAAELYAEAETQRLGAAFNTLYQSLAHHRLTFLARESDSGRKPGVYEFPRELKRVRGVMIQFLVDAFRPNPLQPGPLLRGFYFTGKRPVPARSAGEGMLLDRSASANVSDATSLLNAEQVKAEFERAMARGGAAAPPPEPMVDRWCFVSQLFHEVVQTGPAPVHRYGDRRFDLYRRLAFGGIICICALLALGVLYSAWNNRQFLSGVDEAAMAIQNAPVDDRELTSRHLDDLDKLRARLVDLNDYDHRAPWPRLGFFLYRGDDVAGSARTVYFTYFNKYMLEPVAKRLAGDLSGLPPTKNDTYPFDQVYDGLGTYLRITEGGCLAEPLLRDALMKAWSSIRPSNEGQAETIRNQFEFYVDERLRKRVQPLAGRQEAVNRGRDYLGLFDPEERVYRSLIEQVNKSSATVRLSDYTTKAPTVLSGVTDMPGAFTHGGWTEMEEKINKADPSELGDSCVLGKSKGQQLISQLDKPAFARHLREFFTRDYVRKWKAFLAGVKVSAYRDRADASQKLQLLEDRDSPLMWLLYMAHENGNVAAPPGGDGVAARAVEAGKNVGAKALDNSRFGRAAKIAIGVVKPAAGQPAAPPQAPKDALQPVHSVFGTEATNKNWNDANNANYSRALGALRKAMNELAESRSSDPDVTLNAAAKKAVDDGLDTVREMARKFDRGPEGVDEEVKRLLSEPFELAKSHFDADTGKATTAKLNAAGQKLCVQVNRLRQKYPFNSDGKEVASMDDVLRIFSPQTGALYVIYQQDLSRFLALSGKSYQRKADAPKDVKIDDQFLEAFNHLMQISQVLFADGPTAPSMHFSLRVQPNPDVVGITLTMDEQTVAAGFSRQLTWSGGGTHDLKLKVQSQDANVTVASYGDPWGIFTMMELADPRPPGSNDIALSKVQGNARARPEPISINRKDITVHLRIEEFPGGIDRAFDKGFFECKCVPKVATQ